MKLTTVATALVVGVTLASCTENEPKRAEAPPAQQGQFLKALQQGNVTYSPNMAGGQVSTAQGMSSPGITSPGLSSPTLSTRSETSQGLPSQRHLSMPGASLAPLPDPARAAAQEAPVNIPKDARWTLYCASVGGPDRFARMAQLKAYMMAKTELKDWYVVHDEQNSTLFYGFYTAVEKTERSSARAHADRKMISEFRDNDERPFAACFFTPVTPPDPAAPPEWNIVNAPPRAHWSVQIAAFKDNNERKQAAVQAVKELREKGVDAYFHHGQAVSSVCVGLWPEDALKRQEMDGGSAVVDADDAMLITQEPLPAKYQKAKMRTSDGQRLVPFAQRIEIADKSLDAVLKEYPYHFVNYEAQARKMKAADGSTQMVPSPSFLVKVPRDQSGGMNAAAAGGGGLLSPGNGPGGLAPTRSAPVGGRLRGLND
jgi:hypothetical protein